MHSLSRTVCRSLRAWVVLLVMSGTASGGRAAPVAPVAPAAPGSRAATNAPLAAIHSERALMDAWRRGADPKALPVENMTLPIAHHPDGQVQALLKAGRALIPAVDSGSIRAQDVVIELFDTEGRLDGIFIAENCLYDRETSSGYCEGKVRIEQRGARINGVNMVWNLNTHGAKILSQAEVRFDRFMDGIGDLFK